MSVRPARWAIAARGGATAVPHHECSANGRGDGASTPAHIEEHFVALVELAGMIGGGSRQQARMIERDVARGKGGHDIGEKAETPRQFHPTAGRGAGDVPAVSQPRGR